MTEDEKSILDRKLQELADKIAAHPQVTLTYFQPGKKKTGGAYVSVTGQLRKIDDFQGFLLLEGGARISLISRFMPHSTEIWQLILEPAYLLVFLLHCQFYFQLQIIFLQTLICS